jgi:hypothetical protein
LFVSITISDDCNGQISGTAFLGCGPCLVNGLCPVVDVSNGSGSVSGTESGQMISGTHRTTASGGQCVGSTAQWQFTGTRSGTVIHCFAPQFVNVYGVQGVHFDLTRGGLYICEP